jgi:hypothetical protein
MMDSSSLLREILGRIIALETKIENLDKDVREIKDTNKEFAGKISKISLDYSQAKGAIQLANWIALAVVALVAGLGGVWLNSNSNSNSRQILHEKPAPSKPSEIP